MRQGQVEVQFNWVFVLIAGAIILLFFGGLVVRQKSLTDQRFCGDVLNNLDFALSLAKDSPGTTGRIDLGDAEFQFSCSEYACRNTAASSKNLGNDIVFAPTLLAGQEAIVSAQEWNVPFRATNFLYVTVPDIRYYIIYGQQSQAKAAEIFSLVPENVTKELITFASFQSSSFKQDAKVRLVFVDIDEIVRVAEDHWIWDLEDEAVSALVIDSNNKALRFFSKNKGALSQQTGIAYYTFRQDLVGAIFATDVATYACTLQRAFGRLEKVSQVYLTRTQDISSREQKLTCQAFYAVADLISLRDAATACKESIFPACLIAAETAVDGIKASNNELSIEGCPRMY